jgi:5-methylcytosine-specific restriction endonuclease McrA
MKTCKRCRLPKPCNAFGVERRAKDGRDCYCRRCRTELRAAARAAHPETLERARRRWLAEHPERRREVASASQRRHREAARARWQRYQARKRDAFVEDVNPLIVFERDEGRCGICGEPVDQGRFEVDHVIPLARGGEHSYANTQPAHPLCNQRKGTSLKVVAGKA